jgi:hypothetical protein
MLLAPQILFICFAVVCGELTIFFAVPPLLRSFGLHLQQGLLDFLLGFELAGFFAAIIVIAFLFTGAGQYFSGASAERWSGRELDALGSKWRRFHNVPFDYGFGPKSPEIDIDHIAIGPYGVLVVETKYVSMLLDLNDRKLSGRIKEAISQVEDNAGRVRALLNRDFPGIPIRPVVIVWGRWVTPPMGGVRKITNSNADIRIIHGADSENWKPLLNVSDDFGLSDETVNQVSLKLERYIEGRRKGSKSN